ncbi:hypothetical protein M8998_06755 [Sphingobacterium sp. lm-10]|uniref:hypothetical protein n=1 Tax=Sphingobacterium sp. lm-10 TaxID=2944904 RepID=UPI002020A4FF|nr:hypothetical protein [Sphingobacterium sp. lm-10]MCL7987634.1 hypothetical protein [Sphingobacterium sp. lm-10]
MKIVYYIVFALLMAHPLSAQNKYATTNDGRRVILKPDGTWIYAKYEASAPPNPTSIKKGSSDNKKSSSTAEPTRRYIRGPRGGCYYINRNGNKTYVDRSMCN